MSLAQRMFPREYENSNNCRLFLRDSLRDNLSLVVPVSQHSFCFRVRGFDSSLGFDAVSVSYVPDGQSLETALVLNGSLVYIENFGYVDVCRWTSPQEVHDELIRLQQNPSVREEESEEDEGFPDEG